MKPRRLTTANHLAAVLDRVTAENARLVQVCEALVADRDGDIRDERERIAVWLDDKQLGDIGDCIRLGFYRLEGK